MMSFGRELVLFGGFYVTTVWAKLICCVLFMAWLVPLCGYDRFLSVLIFVCCCGCRLWFASFRRLVTVFRYNLSVRLGLREGASFRVGDCPVVGYYSSSEKEVG